jgi:hypothetical protein
MGLIIQGNKKARPFYNNQDLNAFIDTKKVWKLHLESFSFRVTGDSFAIPVCSHSSIANLPYNWRIFYGDGSEPVIESGFNETYKLLPRHTYTDGKNSHIIKITPVVDTPNWLGAWRFANTATVNAESSKVVEILSPVITDHMRTMGPYSHYYMFLNCYNLIRVAPTLLPSTNLGIYCYTGMFESCTNLESWPELPATTLNTNCYYFMFYGNQKLTSITLHATTLAAACYHSMLKACSNLSEVRVAATNMIASHCPDMLLGVSPSGDLYAGNGVYPPTPSGWNRHIYI